jgi:hypothetical protein
VSRGRGAAEREVLHVLAAVARDHPRLWVAVIAIAEARGASEPATRRVVHRLARDGAVELSMRPLGKRYRQYRYLHVRLVERPPAPPPEWDHIASDIARLTR